MQNVVSFSLFNNIPLYMNGAMRNADLVHSVYPGWVARFYVDHTIPHFIRDALVEKGAEVVVVDAPSLGAHYGKYWRFWVARDPNVERFIIRDADSWLNPREAAAVAQWIASGRSFHIMRDSIWHSKKMLAGMWGGVGGTIPNIRDLTDTWGKYSVHGENDQFVSEKIFPLIGDDYLAHDSYPHFPDAHPFPRHDRTIGTSFVGEIVTPEIESMDVWRRLGEYYDLAETLRRQISKACDATAKAILERDEAYNEMKIAVAKAEASQARLHKACIENKSLKKKIKRVISML